MSTPEQPLDLHCSFCGKSQREVKRLIAGARAHICEECLVLCVGALGRRGVLIPSMPRKWEVAAGLVIPLAPAEASRADRCSFCYKPRAGSSAIVVARGVGICDACVSLGVDILDAIQNGNV